MERSWPEAFAPEVVRPFLKHLSISIVALEAWRRGLRVTLLDDRPRRVRIEDSDGHAVEFTNARPQMNTIEGVRLARNKYKTTSFLAQEGFRTPVTRLIDTRKTERAEVVRNAADIGFPIVLKPLAGSKGEGVFTGITQEEQLLNYYDYLVHKLKTKHVVIESHEDGEMDLRVLVIGDQVAGIVHRIPANVTGDGKRTVSELIDAKNLERAKNPFLCSGLIEKDQEVANYVHAAGFKMTSIPSDGEYLRLRGKSNGSAGGDTTEVSHIVSEEIAQEVAKVVERFPGLYAAGVDILYTPKRGDSPEKYTLIEVNATPQIAVNMYPMIGVGKETPKSWIDSCFPRTSRSHIAGEETLTFSLEEPMAALRSGTARQVTLEPIPANRLPFRQKFTYRTDSNLEETSHRRLLRYALRHGVSGSLTREADQLILYAAAEEKNALETFIGRVSAVLTASPTATCPWDDVVRLGFRVEV